MVKLGGKEKEERAREGEVIEAAKGALRETGTLSIISTEIRSSVSGCTSATLQASAESLLLRGRDPGIRKQGKETTTSIPPLPPAILLPPCSSLLLVLRLPPSAPSWEIVLTEGKRVKESLRLAKRNVGREKRRLRWLRGKEESSLPSDEQKGEGRSSWMESPTFASYRSKK